MVESLVIKGLDEFRRDLRRAHQQLPRALQVAFKNIAVEASGQVQTAFRSHGRLGAKAASGVRPRASQKSAKIALLGTNPVIRGVEFGAKKHPVFGRFRAQSGFRRRVFPEWVGNQHEGKGATFGKGYVATPALNAYVETLAPDRLMDEIYKAFKVAFPE